MGPEALGSVLVSVARLRYADEVIPEGPRVYLLEQVELAIKQVWTEEALRGVCYGMLAWQGAAKDRLLGLMTQIVASEQGWVLTEKGVSMCMYGLHNCGGGPASRAFLAVLAPRVAACSEELTSMSVGNSVFGLHRFVDGHEARAMLTVLTPKVAASRAPMYPQHLASAFFGLVKCSGHRSQEALDMLGALTGHFAACMLPFRAVHLSRILNSLQSFEDAPEVQSVVAAMPQKLADSQEPFSEQQIGMSFFGLQRLGGPAVMQVIAALTPKVADSREPFTAHTLSNICFGLRRCADSAEVRALLRLVATKIVDCRSDFISKDISCMLNGLQRCGNSQESRDILAAIAPKIDQIQELNAQTVGNALYGLRMFQDCPEVRAVFRAVAPKVDTMSEPMSALNVSNAFYGLQRCSNNPEIRELLLALSKRMTEPMSQHQIGMTLYGLLYCGQSEASLAVLAILAEKIAQCPDEFNEQSISISLYGLHNFTATPEVRAVLAALVPHVSRNGHLPLSAQGVANSISGLANTMDCDEARALLRALAPKIAAHRTPLSWRSFVMSMRWLKNLRGECPELQAVLAALVSKAPVAEGLDATSASDALLGLRFAGDWPETRAALALLVPHLASGVESFDHRRVGQTLAGIVCIPASDEAYQALVILAPRIQALAGHLSPVCFEHVMSVLRGSGRGVQPAARELIVSMEPHVVRHFGGQPQQARTQRLREALAGTEGEEAAALRRALDASDAGAATAGGFASGSAGVLPPGWARYEHEGRPYYHHAVHGSRWDQPPPAAADAASLPPGWAEHTAPGGRVFYFHEVHGSVWERPRE